MNSSWNPEICEMSWLTRETCSHCRTPPRYQLRTFVFEGNRMVEVLKDGGPVHAYDSHFQFGTKKAKLLLAALPVIQEFAAHTQDDGTTTVTSQVVVDGTTGSQFQVWVEMHEDFVHSSGQHVQRPWLQIEALSIDSDCRIGLGVQKAKAICAVAPDLSEWVSRGDAQRQRATITLRLPSMTRTESSSETLTSIVRRMVISKP